MSDGSEKPHALVCTEVWGGCGFLPSRQISDQISLSRIESFALERRIFPPPAVAS